MAFRTNKMPVLQEKSASGSVATFNTALAMPLASCNIAVNAWQEGSGDPSPSNVRAIHGFSEVNATSCGINLWDGLWENGQFNWTTGALTPRNDAIRSINYIAIKPSAKYYIHNNLTSNDLRFAYFDQEYNYIGSSNWFPTSSNNVLTVPSNAYFMKLCWVGVTSYDGSISVNYPHTLTGKYPYVTPTIYTKQLGETVYGGSYNSVSGNKRKTHEIITCDGSSDENWVNYSAGNGYYIQIADMKSVNNGEVMSNYLPQYSGVNNLGIRLGFNNNYAYMYQVNTFEGVTDLESWRAYLQNNPLTFVYPLAEPIESNIGATPISTNIGNNTIFADTGNIDLTYKDLDIAKRGNFREVFKLPS